MAEWQSVGVLKYGSVNGSPFERVGDFPDSTAFAFSYRFGKQDLLEAKRGFVVRAIDFAGDFDQMQSDVTTSMSIVAARGATRLAYGVTIPLYAEREDRRVANNKWEINVPDTSVPIGLLRQGAGLVNTNQWAGASTASFVVLTFGPAGRQPNIARQRLLVSPKPQWNATAPEALVEGQPATVRVVVRYPDGEPVVGLGLRFSAANDAVGFRATDGRVVFSTSIDTDSTGVAELPLVVISEDDTAVIVGLSDVRCEPDYFSPPLSIVLPINAQTAMVGGRQCVVIPPVPEQPYVPSISTQVPTFQWDAGAISITSEDGDCEIVIANQDRVVGAVLGFVQEEGDVTDYTRISHGFYFSTSAANVAQAQVIEYGRLRTQPEAYDAGTTFRIQRAGGTVSYVINSTKVFTSREQLTGTVHAGCSLFATGDSV